MSDIDRISPPLGAMPTLSECRDSYSDVDSIVAGCLPGNYRATDEHWAALVRRAADIAWAVAADAMLNKPVVTTAIGPDLLVACEFAVKYTSDDAVKPILEAVIAKSKESK